MHQYQRDKRDLSIKGHGKSSFIGERIFYSIVTYIDNPQHSCDQTHVCNCDHYRLVADKAISNSIQTKIKRK